MSDARHRARSRPLATLLCAAVLAGAACSGGGSDEGASAEPVTSAEPMSFDDPVAIPERYVSSLDTSVTVEAVAGGLDPRYRILPDAFDCHDEADVDVTTPDLRIDFMGDGLYATPDGEGRVGLADDEEAPSRVRQFREGPLDGERIYLDFDDFGQSFGLDANGADFACFQGGASAARAQVRTYLATPQPGEYRCRDAASGETAAVLLEADGRYTVGAERGTWSVEGVVDSEAGRIDFDGGPLDGQGARYSEEEDNGFRAFAVSTTERFGPLGLTGSATSLSLTCEAFGPPVTSPLYGPRAAPVPASGGERLAGFWWYDDLRSSPGNFDALVGYLAMRADGWAYTDPPPVTGVDCTRTRPNGLPFCHAYVLDGQRLLLFAPYGEVDALELVLEDGTVRAVGENAVRPVQPPDPAMLAGRYENLASFRSGCFGTGFCSYGLTKRRFEFSGDRFRFANSSEGGSSVDAGSSDGVSTYASGSSNASNSGTWRLDGHVLELAYDSGRTRRHFAVAGDGGIGVDELLYGPGWTEDPSDDED